MDEKLELTITVMIQDRVVNSKGIRAFVDKFEELIFSTLQEHGLDLSESVVVTFEFHRGEEDHE
jgi:hypothetical protein